MTHTLEHPSAEWTSPIKLAEYLAAKVPVVYSDIPALKPLLDDSIGFPVTPDDPDALVAGIVRALECPEGEQTVRVNKGLDLARKWSYKNRCKLILESLNQS